MRERSSRFVFPGCFTLLDLGEQVADDDPMHRLLVILQFKILIVRFVRREDTLRIFGAD